MSIEPSPSRLIASNTETLKQQSRSFAIPIMQLSPHLQVPIMVQYNLNKTIDTIEDHKQLSFNDKKDLINAVCQALENGSVSARARHMMLKHTPEEESFVFRNYGDTIHLFNQMPSFEKTISLQWTRTMGTGMIKFLNQPIETLHDLNEYCYYVAGTVGIYLTELIVHHYPHVIDDIEKTKEHAMGFGRFLQKLNILRDHVEDQEKSCGSYWPQELFSRYNKPIDVLNFLCYDTLAHDVEHALKYYQLVHHCEESFDNFIRFILYSGLEYIKLIKNNQNIFSKIKVKLPRIFIKGLFSQMQKLSSEDFFEQCSSLLEKEINSYKLLLNTDFKTV